MADQSVERHNISLYPDEWDALLRIGQNHRQRGYSGSVRVTLALAERYCEQEANLLPDDEAADAAQMVGAIDAQPESA